MAQTLEIECPMCHGTLTIDKDSGKVLEHREFKKEKLSLEDFLKSEKTRRSERKGKEPPLRNRKEIRSGEKQPEPERAAKARMGLSLRRIAFRTLRIFTVRCAFRSGFFFYRGNVFGKARFNFRIFHKLSRFFDRLRIQVVRLFIGL